MRLNLKYFLPCAQCGFVEVLYVDYGDVASVSVHSIFLLKTSFQVLPAQMIRARLSHLQPSDMEQWQQESRRVMLEMCHNKSLVALVTGTVVKLIIGYLPEGFYFFSWVIFSFFSKNFYFWHGDLETFRDSLSLY